MKITVLKEASDTRVAMTPAVCQKWMASKRHSIFIEKGAGQAAGYTDQDYQKAGAKIVNDVKTALKETDVLLCLSAPAEAKLSQLRRGTVLIGTFNKPKEIDFMIKKGFNAFSLDRLPRISRAQDMDILSSQSNLAGYAAVIHALSFFPRVFPMMMTSAGTITPARVLVIGAGVAGLQAIATAHRLGAVVYGYDVRPAAKDQVLSLGAKFVSVDEEEMAKAETSGGYAKEMSAAYKKKAAAVLAEEVAKADMIITTAMIPGKPAPKLITEAMVKKMKPGSVIVDVAAATGGNTDITAPGKNITKHGVQIIGHPSLAQLYPKDASDLYSNNLFRFLSLMTDKDTGQLRIDASDELIRETLLQKPAASK